MSPIPIHISNNQGLVWTVDDIATLRGTHHICGSLVGTLPSAAQQNVFLGLPLLLMPEEVVLLVEKQLAILVDERASYPPPTRTQLSQWETAQEKDVQEQQAAREERDGKPPPVLGAEALRRREMRAAAKAEAAKAKAGAQGGEELLLQEEIRPPPEEPTAGQGKDVPHWVSIPSSSLSLPWYAPRTYTTLASARAAGVWTYPTTPKEKAKCAVFSSLHARGHYLGPGLKFGGDWLVYPGDPLRYHSHFVATAFAGLAAGLRPMDVVAFGRLGTATKKAHLLCAWEEGTGEVTYFSIEWANFG